MMPTPNVKQSMVLQVLALAAVAEGGPIYTPRDTSPRGIVEPVRNRAVRVSRNAPCPCGSGKKSKKCHRE